MMKRPLYEEVFKEGRAKGFDVKSHNQLSENTVEGWYYTPYVFDNRPVIGYAATTLNVSGPTMEPVGPDSLRWSHQVELWVKNSRSGILSNIEDVSSSEHKPIVLTDSKNGGSVVTYWEATDALEKFASASTEYPHVMPYREYRRLVGEPEDKRSSPGDYLTYLNEIGKQFSRPGGPMFVGEIKNLNDFEAARINLEADAQYEACPDFAKFVMEQDNMDERMEHLDEDAEFLSDLEKFTENSKDIFDFE